MGKQWVRRSVQRAALALIAGYVALAQANVESETPSSPVTPFPVREHSELPAHSQSALEGRIKLLAKGLDLDVSQQAALRAVLEAQRAHVKKVWDSTAVPADVRIALTLAISDQTMDQIRALLTEEQRKKFAPPRPPQNPAGNSARVSVDAWMEATRAKPALEH